MAGRFAPRRGYADVAIAIVTFNNADHVDDLVESLRHEAGDLALRVIVADNGSTDDTLAVLARHDDVIAVPTGGNRGYATGINVALNWAGDAGAVLVLNPDLVVEPGAIGAMLRRLRDPGVGAVVPRMLDHDGVVYPSLRREPTIARAIGDALLGSRIGSRPGWSSENDTRRASYAVAHAVDWATGAALLVRADVAELVGAWDPRFFLYSEETDWFRRMRGLGYAAWYEPSATVRHDQGGSGASPRLYALMAVNRVRYVRKHRSRGYAAAFRAAVMLHETMRAGDPTHRAALVTLADERSWRLLPRATRWPASMPRGAVVIPAHDEASVIARTLAPLARLAAEHTIEVIVACNGCTDDTAVIARGFPGVRVLEIAQASKAAALNAGDRAARGWPRLYLDADVEVHPGAVAAVFSALRPGGLLAARPAFRYDTTGAGTVVRAYYRARDRLAGTHEHLWGAGAYGLSERGHAKLGPFPELTADDRIVDAAFSPAEKGVLDTEPVRVRTPTSVRGLLAILTRQRRGNVGSGAGSTATSTARELLATVRSPLDAVDAAVYATLTVVGRRRAAKRSPRDGWERDDSSRGPAAALSPSESL
jgi:GT2 family glycosyltransferase